MYSNIFLKTDYITGLNLSTSIVKDHNIYLRHLISLTTLGMKHWGNGVKQFSSPTLFRGFLILYICFFFKSTNHAVMQIMQI